ncbi:hypothetical protein CDO87_16460 [Sagittula sp. P11]|nr:hypothetical protein CDO87_16460 [Sagittula sp. P11]
MELPRLPERFTPLTWLRPRAAAKAPCPAAPEEAETAPRCCSPYVQIRPLCPLQSARTACACTVKPAPPVVLARPRGRTPLSRHLRGC